MLEINQGFWGVFTAWAYGSADEVTAVKRRGKQLMTRRRRGTLPKGLAPEYWRAVYTAVELLWNDLPDVDKNTWRYGWKKYGNTGRDEFGHWNMNLVGRWSRFLRRRPPTQGLERRVRDYPGSEPLPPNILCLLPGEWLYYSQRPPVLKSYWRYSPGYGPTPAAAWADAWGLVLAQAWQPNASFIPQNSGQLMEPTPGSFYALAFQCRAQFQLGGFDFYCWREQAFSFGLGTSNPITVTAGCRIGDTVFPARRASLQWPEIRGINGKERLTPWCEDLNGWAPPPLPGAVGESTGWHVGDTWQSFYYRK
jgi:hypothetical protein